jgi:hypothetical protein
LGRVIDEADKLGMVVIVGFFYQGSEQRVDLAPGDAYVREAVRQAAAFLKDLPSRNVLIEIANEVSPTMYTHPSLQADGIVELVKIAQNTVARQIPVSFSWVGDPPKGWQRRKRRVRRGRLSDVPHQPSIAGGCPTSHRGWLTFRELSFFRRKAL